MRLPVKAARVFTLAALLFASACAQAAGFNVSPVRVELGPGRESAVLTVRNSGDDPVLLQLHTVSWAQKGGEDIYEPTKDFLATPPIFTVAPGASQIVRVGLRRSPDSKQELTYRIYLQEVPSAPKPGATGLQMVLRVGLPVFVTPKQPAAPMLKWTAARDASGDVRVSVVNDGNAHVQISDFRLTLPGQQQPIAAQQSSAYVLPGQTREWLLKSTLPPKSERVDLKAYTDAGEIQTPLSLE